MNLPRMTWCVNNRTPSTCMYNAKIHILQADRWRECGNDTIRHNYTWFVGKKWLVVVSQVRASERRGGRKERQREWHEGKCL